MILSNAIKAILTELDGWILHHSLEFIDDDYAVPVRTKTGEYTILLVKGSDQDKIMISDCNNMFSFLKLSMLELINNKNILHTNSFKFGSTLSA